MASTTLFDGFGKSNTLTAYRALTEHLDTREVVDGLDELDSTTNELRSFIREQEFTDTVELFTVDLLEAGTDTVSAVRSVETTGDCPTSSFVSPPETFPSVFRETGLSDSFHRIESIWCFSAGWPRHGRQS